MRHSSFLEVHLGLLGDNFEQIQRLAPRANVLPMVKADAYGNGLVPISEFLVRSCGVTHLGCASLGEALRIRSEIPDLKVNLLVFSDTELSTNRGQKAYKELGITPVLHNRDDLALFFRESDFKKIPLILKLNTGMNRLGLSQEDLEAFLPFLKDRGVDHLLTHFARSSQLSKNDDKTSRQYEMFQRLKDYLLGEGVSIKETSVSNSGAIEQGIGIEETYVRPGLMLYGPPSVTSPVLWKGHQISRFVTKVLTTFVVKKGTPIGYGVNVADRDSYMALLPIGYGDGLLTYYSGTQISLNGVQGKIFGRINMDMTFIQFDLEMEEKIRAGDVVEIWNHDSSVISELASRAGTIPYQMMCAISSRIPRNYKVK